MRMTVCILASILAGAACILASCTKDAAAAIEDPGTGPVGGNQVAVFTFVKSGTQCLNAVLSGTYKQDTALNASHTVTIQVDVTQAGSWSLVTNTVNGMSFSGSGKFAGTGPQAITLYGSGKPISGGVSDLAVYNRPLECGFSVPVAFNSVAVISAIHDITLSFQNRDYTTPDGYISTDGGKTSYLSLSLTAIDGPGDTVVTRLVNAGKGKIDGWDSYYSSAFIVSFSNINSYGASTIGVPIDTAGKMQIWIYRKDGKDLMSATKGKPPIKTIIQVIGKVNSQVTTSGLMAMTYHYFLSWHDLKVEFFESLFSRPYWKFGYYERRD